MLKVDFISYKEKPGMWDTLLSQDPVQYPLGSPLDQDYSRSYAADFSFEDFSLIAHSENVPLAGLQITRHIAQDGSENFGFYGRSAFLRTSQNSDATLLAKAERALAEEFIVHYKRCNSPTLDFQEMCINGNLSDFSVALLKEGAVATPLYKQEIDLLLDSDLLKRDLRKSYKSLINWGEQNLNLTVYDHRNITPDIMERFRQLHISVAGKETRPKKTWDIQYQQIAEKQAFIIMGHIDDAIVTAALFLHTSDYCFYGVSASIREMFDKPLSHAVIWRGIQEAKERGCKIFEMGDLVQLYNEEHSEKEKNIATFKRGFGGHAKIRLKIGMTGISSACTKPDQ